MRHTTLSATVPPGAQLTRFLLFAEKLPAATQLHSEGAMAYVITDTCTMDDLCTEACPVDCIHPKRDEAARETVSQLFVNPTDCIDCGACVPVCPTNSIYPLEELPAELAAFAEKNAAYYN